MEVEAIDSAQVFEANIIARQRPMNEVTARGDSAVQKFYDDTAVFITGGTGFLGKQLIEKLFRATSISKIFVLIRDKKGKFIQERMNEMLEDPVYDTLRKEKPEFVDKIVPISGDVAELRLGLSNKDWDTITEQADIIYHVAATTRFDESLRVATLINVRGTREAITLGKACKHLKSFVHVSTAFSHACTNRAKAKVAEDFYPSPIEPNTLINLVETVEEWRINDIAVSLIKNWPNTYSFAKAVAEELINTMANDLPICIVRPSIVICSRLEPNPGWLDMSCVYGACGMYIIVTDASSIIIHREKISALLVGCGMGVMHTIFVDKYNIIDAVPVDYVNNAIIVAGWETANRRIIGETKTKIYTVASGPRNRVIWDEIHEALSGPARAYSTPLAVSRGFCWCTKNPVLFWIYSWLLHIIPAYIVDGICVVCGFKKRYVKLAKKMYRLSTALSYFLTHDWYFLDQNTENLYNSLSSADQQIFNFNIKDINWTEYIIICWIGVRKYILKDGLKRTNYGCVVKYLKEVNENKIDVVIIDDYHASPFNPQSLIYKQQLEKNLTFNVLKKGQWGSYYYLSKKNVVEIQNLSLTVSSFEDLDNFSWVQKAKETGYHVKVNYAGISARDCQKALGIFPQQTSTFGMDFSGIDSQGDQVMGLVSSGALSTEIKPDPTLLWPVPRHWSLQDAATVPLPYIHAYYILATMKCVSIQGKFIDVSFEDINANTNFGICYLSEGRQYKISDLSSLFKPENIHDRKALQIMMVDGIAKGIVKPLSRIEYSPLDVARAFKLLSSSRHRGRVLIRISDSKSLLSNEDLVLPRMLYTNGVQIVVCDTSDIGVELVNHLIKNGARNIVIHMRRDHQTSYLYVKAASWKKMNVTVGLNSENLQTKEGCDRLLEAGRKLGPVTSIFLIQDYKENTVNHINVQAQLETVLNDIVLIAANLDMVSRTSFTDLCNFVIISVSSKNIGSEHVSAVSERICETREKIGLPSLILRAYISNAVDQNNALSVSKLESSVLSSLFNALDISLKFKYRNAQIFSLPHSDSSPVAEKLGETLGVKNIDDIDENVKLNEINVNDMVMEEINSKLRPVKYSDEELGKMTISRLKQLYIQFGIKKRTNFEAGLGAFFRCLENNECRAIDPVINMKTKLTIKTDKDDEWHNREKNHMMFIPGFDGRYQVFETVAERLKIRAATLQLGPDILCESIPEIAQVLTNHIKTNFKTLDKFYIMGYSFGVNVALEIAKILETEGRTGVVYCLDSSPDALKAQLNAYVGCLTDTQLQNAVLTHMYSLMTGQESIELKKEIEKSDTWVVKMDLCLSRLRDLVNFSHQHRRSILESAYKRILLAREYKSNFRLASDIVLIRGIPHPNSESLAEDYGLSKYTKQPVKVFHIESDHAAAPYDCRVSNIINKMLDPTLIEEFKRTNLCEHYCI